MSEVAGSFCRPTRSGARIAGAFLVARTGVWRGNAMSQAARHTYGAEKRRSVPYGYGERRASRAMSTPAPAKPHTSKGHPVTVMGPIPIRSGAPALAVRVAQPLLLALILLTRFSAIVATSTALLGTLIATTSVQVTFALVCLPPAGTSAGSYPKKTRPGAGRRSEIVAPNRVVTAGLALILALIATPVLHVVFVLFGAPFLEAVQHTLLCAAHFSVLALFPLFYVHGMDGPAWRTVVSAAAPVDEAFGGYAGAVVGAWLGAIPIPLDWDRDWQKWPVTIICGIYGGYIVGKWLGGTFLFGKHFAHSGTKSEGSTLTKLSEHKQD